MKTALELLCPARDLEAGKLAFNYGADAVYIGAPKFGARAAAGNPVSDIERLANFGHQFGAKTYVTLNTLLYEQELDEALRLIRELYNAGIDALIIQDLGLLEMDLPPLPLFASTQTHNYETERIQFLEKAGFQRIILARELSVKQIQEIRRNTQVELEAFVHGALCVSLSGQCNFSQAMCGRSANRGECAQACRMPFDLLNNDGSVISRNKHFLSLKDFNAGEQIFDLIRAGITSFKIEGRLKDSNYLINNTAYYRKLIDSFLYQNPDYTKASAGSTELSFEPDPERSFNRGFTPYFLENRPKNLANFSSPKSLGKALGMVKSVSANHFELETTEPIVNGDGLCYINKFGELQGFPVNGIQGSKIFPDKMPALSAGILVYRNFDKAFTKNLESNTDKRKIDVQLVFGEENDGFRLNATDEDGVSVSEVITHPKETAKDAERAIQTIEKQLTKSGDSIFRVTDFQYQAEQAYFFPASMLNEIRRNCLDKLHGQRLKEYKRPQPKRPETDAHYFKDQVFYQENIANSLSRIFYEKHGAEVNEKAFELLNKTQQDGKTIMTTRYCIKYELQICPHKQKPNPNLQIKEPIFLKDKNRRYRLDFDCEQCFMKVLLED